MFPLLAPLVIYLVYKDTNPFVRLHAAESLNFHLTLTIGFIISGVLTLVLIGILGLLALAIIGPVFGILAAIKAGQGLPYRYPLTIHFVN